MMKRMCLAVCTVLSLIVVNAEAQDRKQGAGGSVPGYYVITPVDSQTFPMHRFTSTGRNTRR